MYMRAVDNLTPFVDDGRRVPLSQGLLEIYKLSVEMADRVSARRAIASSFLLIVQSGLVAFLAFVHGQRWSIALAGIVVAVTWWLLLRSYRHLNRAKFLVIHEMEKQLPAAPYTDEWRILDTDDVPLNERYAALGLVEQAVPVVFLAINLVALVWDLK
jgi:hypothetical protein